ncbi:hypothetical protein C5167_019100 [Papaver somniferum]|uniref:CCHC-type domain-containing protein n=1 Tax=Papaver somniferum TaxID=3469 RepID=A0A4Y7ISA8_PAPSO|nr:hypothetical protein C5167_019100 [Papaver somniferum]
MPDSGGTIWDATTARLKWLVKKETVDAPSIEEPTIADNTIFAALESEVQRIVHATASDVFMMEESIQNKGIAFKAVKIPKAPTERNRQMDDSDEQTAENSDDEIEHSLSLITRQFRDLLKKRNKRFIKDTHRSSRLHDRVPVKKYHEEDDKYQPQCFKCKGFEHIAKYCPNLKKYT